MRSPARQRLRTMTGVLSGIQLRGAKYRTALLNANSVNCRERTANHSTLLTTNAGEKVRLQQEESERRQENEKHASGSYTVPEPEDVDEGEESGLPWGTLSFRHVIVTGKTKEQSSKETSRYAAASKTGGSSR